MHEWRARAQSPLMAAVFDTKGINSLRKRHPFNALSTTYCAQYDVYVFVDGVGHAGGGQE